ncbi:hypothetical protein OG21DRAFT_588782 [Imleria badia]|nr:hypothetical protein OG21DRAFT_588782 [Imleria badia]
MSHSSFLSSRFTRSFSQLTRFSVFCFLSLRGGWRTSLRDGMSVWASGPLRCTIPWDVSRSAAFGCSTGSFRCIMLSLVGTIPSSLNERVKHVASYLPMSSDKVHLSDIPRHRILCGHRGYDRGDVLQPCDYEFLGYSTPWCLSENSTTLWPRLGRFGPAMVLYRCRDFRTTESESGPQADAVQIHDRLNIFEKDIFQF